MLRHLAFFTFLRGAATEGGRGHAVATTAWQSTQHLPSDYVPSAGRASVIERLKAEAKAAEEAGALGLKKGEAD